MWKDINGKTGYKNMQGVKYLYGNLKLLTTSELNNALVDGIGIWVKPVPPPILPTVVLERLKKEKTNAIKSLFEIESVKPVNIGGINYKGGYNTVSRIDSARRLGILSATDPLTLYDIDDNPVKLTPAQIEVVVKGLGTSYQSLYSIRQKLIVRVLNASNPKEVGNVIIPWSQPTTSI